MSLGWYYYVSFVLENIFFKSFSHSVVQMKNPGPSNYAESIHTQIHKEPSIF
jgi:hypothetical protein